MHLRYHHFRDEDFRLFLYDMMVEKWLYMDVSCCRVKMASHLSEEAVVYSCRGLWWPSRVLLHRPMQAALGSNWNRSRKFTPSHRFPHKKVLLKFTDRTMTSSATKTGRELCCLPALFTLLEKFSHLSRTEGRKVLLKKTQKRQPWGEMFNPAAASSFRPSSPRITASY